ncbi:hypothetical protein EJ06DRAFT_206631 [Trichodelitschia bisporula]|uniref:SAC3/GANP/THP3 conserved domain-containing protein n=1 Tax=Trichodelitschia bisporula TaxID=703511 RepID=A0A6G1I856_9PEZI|nr:hypothetical protein EJ06DRAFT_206631 [Trichodelitschia bisporula]
MAGRRGGRGQGSQQQQQSRDSNPRHRTNGDEGSSGRGRGHGRGDRGQSNGQSRTSNHDQNRNSPQDGGRGQSNGARRTKPPVDLTRHVLEKNLAANHGPPKAPKKMVDTQPEPRARSNSQVKHGPIPAGAAERWAQLTRNRDKERMDAIANGFLADPAQPRKLEDAITPVGTCEDMCPEFERVQRIVQNDVWRQEWERQTQALDYGKRTPDESRMVKKFRRAAAGLDEQLPSDLRPPRVLLKTTNYLLNELPTESSDDISKIQAFLWDRTRAIRNDFSIQQLKEVEDIRIAIDCYERIARFHIFSLHQMAAVDRKGAETYDWQQDREQLDRTLLTLLDYYGKVRLQYQSPNEVEFRVYDILLHIQSPQPYMEYKVQGLPDHIRLHPRILKAMELWEAATNSIDLQGPFLESVPHVVVQENWARFWKLIMSNQVSYLMACVAEVYFNLIRRTALQSIFRAFKLGGTQRTTAWVMPHVMDALGFDTEEEAHEYVAYFGLKFQTRDDGVLFLDISAMKGADLPSPSGGMVPQKHSKRWVEMKRRGRTFKAIVNGLSTKAARQAGWVEKAPTVSADSTMTESYEQSARTSTASTAPPSEPVAKLNPIAPPFALSASLAGAATFTGTPPTAPSLATGQANGFGQPSGFGQPPTIAPPSVLNRPSSFAPFTESSPPTSSASSSGFGQPFGTSQGPAFGPVNLFHSSHRHRTNPAHNRTELCLASQRGQPIKKPTRRRSKLRLQEWISSSLPPPPLLPSPSRNHLESALSRWAKLLALACPARVLRLLLQ